MGVSILANNPVQRLCRPCTNAPRFWLGITQDRMSALGREGHFDSLSTGRSRSSSVRLALLIFDGLPWRNPRRACSVVQYRQGRITAQRARSIAENTRSQRCRSRASATPGWAHHATRRSPAVLAPVGAALWKRSRSLLDLQREPLRLELRRAFEAEHHFELEQHLAARFGAAARSASGAAARGGLVGEGARARRRAARASSSPTRRAAPATPPTARSPPPRRRPRRPRRAQQARRAPRTGAPSPPASATPPLRGARARADSAASTAAFAFVNRDSTPAQRGIGAARLLLPLLLQIAQRAAQLLVVLVRRASASCSSCAQISSSARRPSCLRSSSSLRLASRAWNTASHAARNCSQSARSSRCASASSFACACHRAWIALTCDGASRSIAFAASAVGLLDQRHAARLRLVARRGQRVAQRGERGLEPRIEASSTPSARRCRDRPRATADRSRAASARSRASRAARRAASAHAPRRRR